MATESQIKNVVKKQLASFNSTGVHVNDDTVINSAIKGKRAEDLFQANILWTLDTNKHKPSNGDKNKMPTGWRNLTPATLAQKLFILICILIGTNASAQLTMNIGTVKTDLKSTALNLAFSYINSMDSVINRDFQINKRNSYFIVTPDVRVQTGTNDAFSSLTAKATGLFAKFQTTTVEGLVTPDADRTMHVFPVSVGAETNNQFTFVNTIVEAGYEPYWNSQLHRNAKLLEHLKWGAFLQAGYKWSTKYDSTKLVGGATDESEENKNSGILRVRSYLSLDSKRLVTIAGGFGLGLIGDAGVWADVLNGAFYYRINGAARVYLSNNAYFDLFYQRGSGAPNFNQGKQFGTGLTITF